MIFIILLPRELYTFALPLEQLFCFQGGRFCGPVALQMIWDFDTTCNLLFASFVSLLPEEVAPNKWAEVYT